jgi:hypothetical protein
LNHIHRQQLQVLATSFLGFPGQYTYKLVDLELEKARIRQEGNQRDSPLKQFQRIHRLYVCSGLLWLLLGLF